MLPFEWKTIRIDDPFLLSIVSPLLDTRIFPDTTWMLQLKMEAEVAKVKTQQHSLTIKMEFTNQNEVCRLTDVY